LTVSLRRATDRDDDLSTIATIVNATSPEDSTSVDEMRWSDATYPGTVRFLAEKGGQAVGAATVGRIWVYPPDYDAYWATVHVLPEARRSGTGGALLEAAAVAARAAGKRHLHVPASAARPDAISFLEGRGFSELERARAVRLDLAGHVPAEPRVPDAIELTDLAARPDLVPGVHEVAVEAFRDIPGSEPMAPGDLAEFRSRDVDRPGIPREAFVVAVERAGGRVVGYASLLAKPGDPGVAYHDMTAVVRSWRGHGLATAMKLRTIAWAIANGLTALETGNDEDNLAMQAVNRRLGYRPEPDLITMRGAVDAAMMTR
jgi:mycothiol synthase